MVYNFNFEENFTEDIFQCGIYKIYYESTPTKVYIGSALKSQTTKYKKSSGFWHRFRSHASRLISNKHHSVKLQNAFNKYGKENFKFEIIEFCFGKECINREQYWIDFYDSCTNGYNCAPIAGSMVNFKHSKKTKDKISATKKEKRDAVLDEIIFLRNTKKTFKEISTIVNISHRTVSRILKENDIIVDKAFTKKIIIYQYNIEGDLIRIWDSITDCSMAIGISTSRIVRNLKDDYRKVKGYCFRYTLLSKEQVVNFINTRKPNPPITEENRESRRQRQLGKQTRKRIENIKQWDINDNLIKIWKDSKELVIFYGLKNFSPILRVIKKQRKQYKGYKWTL